MHASFLRSLDLISLNGNQKKWGDLRPGAHLTQTSMRLRAAPIARFALRRGRDLHSSVVDGAGEGGGQLDAFARGVLRELHLKPEHLRLGQRPMR